MSKFSEKDFQFAESWRPRQNDILEGPVRERSERVSDYGSYPILTLETNSGRVKTGDMITGEIAVHGLHTSLKNQIEEQNPQPGDYVGILFQGEIVREDADNFYGYRMRVKRGGYPPVDPVEPARTPNDEDDVPF